MIHLGSTFIRMKLKGIDGGRTWRWNTWFNSMIREEPYQGPNVKRPTERSVLFRTVYKVHMVVVNRAVRCRVKSHNEAQPLSLVARVMSGTLERLPVQTERKVGMTSNHHGPYVLGPHTCYNGQYSGMPSGDRRQSIKLIPVRIGVSRSTL